MTSVMVGSARSGSSGPNPVTSWTISSTRRVALLAGDREAALGSIDPVDQPLDPLVDLAVLGVEQRLERADDLGLEAVADLADEVLAGGRRSRPHHPARDGRTDVRRPDRHGGALRPVTVRGDRDGRDGRWHGGGFGRGRGGGLGRFGRCAAVLGCLSSLLRLLGALHALKQRHDLDVPLIVREVPSCPVGKPLLWVLPKSSPFFLPAGLRPRTTVANSVPRCHPSGPDRTARHHRGPAHRHGHTSVAGRRMFTPGHPMEGCMRIVVR